MLVGMRCSAPIQTRPGAQPASCTIGTGLFPQDKAALTIHSHIAPWLKKEYSYTPTTLSVFIAYSRVKFIFHYFRLININGIGEDSRFLRHDAVLFGNYYPTF
jgi:hypothetical protein